MTKTFTIKKIAEALDGDLIGDATLLISRPSHPLDVRSASDLALVMDPNLLPFLEGSAARAIVVSTKMDIPKGLDACIVVKRPRLAMAKITALFAEDTPLSLGIHPTAVVEVGAEIGDHVTIGAHSYVGAGAKIGHHSVLHPQTYVAPNARIGDHALIHSGVRIGTRVEIGDHVIIHFNASIGADGFSFVTPQTGSVEAAKKSGSSDVVSINQELVRIASLGNVVIGHDVEIGANTSIDRGTLAATRIGNGTKIDNQVQIGHNVVIGENCLICGRVGIAGSSIVGDRVVLGGATGIADHVKVGDDVVAMAMSGIGSNIAPRAIVGGIPAAPRERVMENLFNISRIKHFLKKIDALTLRLDALEREQKND